MINIQSIHLKAIALFGAIALVVLGTSMVMMLSARSMTHASHMIIYSGIPVIRGAEQMLFALNNANSALTRGLRMQHFSELHNVQRAESEFNNAVLRYSLFAAAIEFGSTTQAFRTYHGGLIHGAWRRRNLDAQFVIEPAAIEIQQTVSDSNESFHHFVATGQQLLMLQKKALRLSYIGEKDAYKQVQDEIYETMKTIDALSKQTIENMQYIVEANDVLMAIAGDNLQDTQRPLFSTIILSSVLIMGMILCCVFVIRRFLLNPVWALTKSVRKLAEGNLDERSAITSHDEIGFLAQSFNTMANKLEESHNTLEEKVREQTEQIQEKMTEAEQQTRAIVNVLEDLDDEREKTLEEIKNTKKFELAVGASSDGIIITKNDTTILYVNHAWEKLTGYSAAEALGKNAKMLQSDQTPEEIRKKMHFAVHNGTEFHSDALINKRKNGSVYNAELSIYPIKDGEKIHFLVGVHKDITQRIREDVAKTEFVSLASHQLRTPLTAILWIFDMFRKGKVGTFDDKQKELLTDAWTCANNMSETVSSMLMLSRLEAGKIHIKATECHLQDLWQIIWKDHHTNAEQRNQTCDVSIPDDLTLETDESLLKEVVSNLVSNALKYSPDEKTIHVKAEKQASNCIISVKDEGYGIPSHQKERIFTKFFRADNVIEHQTDGSGLGLYLVHSLVEFLGGTIQFDSEENQGTTFIITIPLKHHE